LCLRLCLRKGFVKPNLNKRRPSFLSLIRSLNVMMQGTCLEKPSSKQSPSTACIITLGVRISDAQKPHTGGIMNQTLVGLLIGLASPIILGVFFAFLLVIAR
jgi:hypothetical protein